MIYSMGQKINGEKMEVKAMKQKMRKISERIACLAIALVMLLCMLPVFPASAADNHQLVEAEFTNGFQPTWLDPSNIWTQSEDGTINAPAKTNAPYYFNRSNSYAMTNYTFQADITLPAGFAANTQLGGLCFGVMDGNEAGKVSRYEFTISYIAATDTAEAGWAARVYKRANATGDYQYNVNGSNTAVNSKITVSTDRTKETTFTMKVVVEGLTMQCYIDDVLVIDKTITQTKDANFAREAINGGVALYGFGNSTSTFSNVKLTSKNFNLSSGRWQNDGTWTFDLIDGAMIAPTANSILYANKASTMEMSDYVFQTDVILPENANANTQLGGIFFGCQDASGVTSRYEFTVSQTADGWCPRLYKRSTVDGYAGYTCVGNHTTVNNNVKITEGIPFTMRVVLNDLTAACYINDVLAFNFQVTKTSDAALAQGKIMGSAGLIGFKNANAIFSNTKLFKQAYLGFSQNFDELGTDANVLLKNEGWMGAAGWAGNMSQDPIKDNISVITDEGKLQVKAGGVVGLRNYKNAYVVNPLTMSNYTFEAEVFVPAVEDITDYKLLGLGFGAKEKSSSSYVGYEFSVHPSVDESGNEIWKFRIYDRYNSKTPVAEKTIKNVDLALGEAFTMKVALDGAMAYCYINDTLVCCFQDTDTIVGFPSLMGPNTGSATAIFDNVKLYPTDAITYEESFDSLSANTNSASVLQNLDKLNSAWFADAADASGIAGINGKFRPLRIGADGSNKFVQTYHNQYSYMFDTQKYDNGYELEADVTYTGIGIDGLETTTTKGDYFGLLFGLNENADGNIGGYEYVIIYSEGQWRVRLYDRVEGALLAYVALPKSVAAKITNHEAINFKVALYGATAYCFLDDVCVITYAREDGNTISGDVGFMAHSGAAATEDRTAAEVRTLVNYDNFKFKSKAVSMPKVPAATVESWNLALGDNVGMNFYLNIADDAQDVKIQITVAGETAEYTVDQLTVTEAGYKVSAELAAAQVTEVVNVQVIQGEDVIVSENYTIEEYANYILNDETDKYDEATKALVVELLNYCDKAQTYFEHNIDNRVTVDLSNAGKADVSGEGVADMVVSGSVSGVNFYGASMVFESKNAVRFYFTGDLSGCIVSDELAVVTKDGMSYVEVADINPDKLTDTVTVTLTSGDQTLTVSYSPMNYIVRMSQKGSENLQALLKALYNYHLAAVAYVSK